VATSTRQAVRERLMRYGIGRSGTNTGTSTSAITDNGLKGHRAAPMVDVGCAVMITSGGAAPENEFSRVSATPVVSTGTFNISPVLTAALANADTYDLLYLPFEFDGRGQHSVHDQINQALVTLEWEKRLIPVTLAADGDMLGSGTTDWTTSGSSVAKTAATFPYGRRVLAVTDSGSAGGYARTASIAVEEGKSYYLEATGSGVDASDAGTLVLFDVTNSAAITISNSVIDRIEPELLVNSVTIPSGCEQVQIRLTCTNASDVIHWSDVIFRKDEATEFTLADRPQRVGRIGRVLETTSTTWSRRGLDFGDEAGGVPRETEQLDAGLWRLRLGRSVAGRSVWYEEFIQPAEMTADTSTTTIPLEAVAALAAERLLYPLQIEEKWAPFYAQAARAAAKERTAYQQHLRTVPTRALDYVYLDT